jgi:outer membrane protein assembly factor BamA
MRRWAVALLLLAACGAGKGSGPTTAPAGAASSESAKPAPGSSICTAISKRATGNDVIARVEVRGQSRLTPAAICNLIKSKAGELADVDTVQGDIRRLWAGGDVDDVFVSSEDSPIGRVLTFEVRERPLVKEWHIEGFKVIDAARVRERLGPVGQPLNASAVDETLARLRV